MNRKLRKRLVTIGYVCASMMDKYGGFFQLHRGGKIYKDSQGEQVEYAAVKAQGMSWF